jgi:hypothetical protein
LHLFHCSECAKDDYYGLYKHPDTERYRLCYVGTIKQLNEDHLRDVMQKKESKGVTVVNMPESSIDKLPPATYPKDMLMRESVTT